jgi:hypothetical protein
MVPIAVGLSAFLFGIEVFSSRAPTPHLDGEVLNATLVPARPRSRGLPTCHTGRHCTFIDLTDGVWRGYVLRHDVPHCRTFCPRLTSARALWYKTELGV